MFRSTQIKVQFGIAVLFLFTSIFASAQDKFSDNLTISGNYQFGFMLPEYAILGHTITDPAQSIDLSIYKERYGKNKYEQIYGYPQIGLSLFYTSLGNREIYGDAVALGYFFRLNIINKKRFQFFNRLGIGMGYITQKHDMESNHLNVVIGSNWNIHFNARLGTRFHLTDQFSLNAGVSFDHFSNGNISEPNIGLNGLTAYTGVNYLIGKKMDRITNDISNFKRTHSMEVFANGGLKRTRAFLSRYYVALSGAFDYNYQLSHIFALGAGADLFYDSSIKPQLEKSGETIEALDNFQTGIHISQSLIYKKFWFTLQEGVYVGLTNQLHGKPAYIRGMVRYFINEHFSARVSMKSHLNILDYPDIGIGYKF